MNFNSPQLKLSEQKREDEGGAVRGRGSPALWEERHSSSPTLTRLQHSHQHLSREQVWEETNKVQIRK